MEIVSDLHLHSKYSRAVSKKMTLPNMYLWARKKGINLLSVADFTHPEWYRHILDALEEVQSGIYSLKRGGELERANNDFFGGDFLGPYFMLTTEISLIYSQDDVVHRVHLLVLAPDVATVGKINKTFLQHDFTLGSDGRPTFGISCIELCELLFAISPDIHIIPCHVWTPWFSLYGSKSGFDSIEAAFGKYADKIFAIETGLSSDPVMNWRIPELDNRSIVSFGDAHSFYKLGREATVLRGENLSRSDMTYTNIVEGLRPGGGKLEIGYTIEFYPEEGKYHHTGHRACGVSHSPRETKKLGTTCPVCGKDLTVGVMHRVEDLAGRVLEVESEIDEHGVVWQRDREGKRPPYVSLVPLQEQDTEVVGKGVNTKTTLGLYDLLVSKLDGEFEVLMRAPLSRIESVGGQKMAEAVSRVRSRNIVVEAGFDGEFGKVKIWEDARGEDKQIGLGI